VRFLPCGDGDGSLELVNLWSSRHTNVAPILDEVGELVSGFESFFIQHIRRSSNNMAHLSVKLACTLEVTSSWLDDSPDFLVNSLRAACTGNFYSK
jgi:hypothetical protein